MENDPVQLARQTLDKALAARERADISWIRPPPETNGWTLAADALKFLDALVRELRPGHVIEFGAGLSTKVLARACVEMNSPCSVSSIDHDPQFGVSDTRSIVESSKNLTLASQIAPLVARDYGGKLLPTYFWDTKKFASNEPADLVLIDGPPVDLGGREGVLYAVLEHCRAGTIVLLDDASRGSERRAARNWQETLGDAIQLQQLPKFTKGMAAVIVSRPDAAKDLWSARIVAARKQIESFVAPQSKFVLVERANFGEFAEDRIAAPLVSRDNEDWGSPQDDESATAELERSRKEGATHLVLPWTSFWWIDCYPKFFAELRERYRCVADGDLLLAFDLR